MTNHPNIGLDNAMAHFFNVLCPAYERFKERQTRANGLDVAKAAWDLVEWLRHDKGNPDKGQFRRALFNRCSELELMRDWAEAAKHPELHRGSVNLVSITGAENPGGTLQINEGPVRPEGPFRGNLITVPSCTLTMNCADGSTHSVPDVLQCVVEFWSKELIK